MSPRIPESAVILATADKKAHVSYSSGTSQDSQESWRSRGAVDNNVAQSVCSRRKNRPLWSWNNTVSSRRTRGVLRPNTGRPRRTRGRHESAWSWLEVALESTWESARVGLELAWSHLAVVWPKFKNSNLKNSDRWSRMRAVWLFFPQSYRSLGGFVYVWQGFKDG